MTNSEHARERAGEELWSVASVLTWATDDLRKRDYDAPRLDAELLLGKTLGLDRVQLILQHQRPLSEAELGEFKRYFIRRRNGEPMAYILGAREFYGFDVQVDSRVLVPRPDSEILVEVALKRTRARDMYGRALDLCTGSGCIAFAIGANRKTWKVLGSDISQDALAVARVNALRLGLTHNVHFCSGDLYEALPLDRRFELIVVNPPYIPSEEIRGLMRDVRDFEPHLALDGGSDGLALVRRIVAGAPARLEPGGVLACEVGAGQSSAVALLFTRAGFEAIECSRDYGGHERVVSGRLKG